MSRQSAAAACEWCGRAVARDAEGRWYAVKGEERGYDPLACEASDDHRHHLDGPADPERANCGASLAVVPAKDYGAEVRYLCIVPADEPHDWHVDRFDPDFQWKASRRSGEDSAHG